ncbi:MAG: nuclear transport factor 2 family protein [Actinomycetota bacterium]|nr:nuclear transport factor 2 family protein [Actinomycetota bacterium]
MAAKHDRILAAYRREVDPAEYTRIRDLYKAHSIAEDARDLPGLIATLTSDCVYEFPQSRNRWVGHEGAARFYGELLNAFPDISFDLSNIVIGPQGVWEEADVSATWAKPWRGWPASGQRIDFVVQIFFPWDPEAGLFRGERVYVGDPSVLMLHPPGR